MEWQRRGRRASLTLLVLGSLAAAVSPQWPIARPQNVNPCSCEDPIGGPGTCYEPVCPPGYFKCCATCKISHCASTGGLQYSWRGLPECILCGPGDYCEGCDVFKKCPPNIQPGREGPRASKPGSSRLADCESCGEGQMVSLWSDTCIDKYDTVCNMVFVQRCQQECTAEDPRRRKDLNDCERMKCSMYCAKRWSDACAASIGKHCREVTMASPGNPDALYNCSVNCNFSSRTQEVGLLTLLIPLLVLLLTGREQA